MEREPNTAQVQLRLPVTMLTEIDEVKDPEMSRSAWIRGAVRLRIRKAREDKAGRLNVERSPEG